MPETCLTPEREAVWVGGNGDKPERVYFHKLDAFNAVHDYLDAFNDVGDPVDSYKLDRDVYDVTGVACYTVQF